MKDKKLGKPAKYGERMSQKLFIRFTEKDFKLITSKAKRAGYVGKESGTSAFARDLILEQLKN